MSGAKASQSSGGATFLAKDKAPVSGCRPMSCSQFKSIHCPAVPSSATNLQIQEVFATGVRSQAGNRFAWESIEGSERAGKEGCLSHCENHGVTWQVRNPLGPTRSTKVRN